MIKKLELGPKQRATIASALTLGAALLLLCIVYAAFGALAAFVGAFQSVLLPPVVAGILAMLCRPYYDWLYKVCRSSQISALVLFFLSALLPLGVLLWVLVVFSVNQMLGFLEDVPSIIASLRTAVQSHWPEVSAFLEKHGLLQELRSVFDSPSMIVSDTLRILGQKMYDSFVQMSQSVAGMFSWAVLPIYLAFFLIAKPFSTNQIEEFLPFLKKDTRNDILYLIDQFINILLTFFRGQIIIAIAQGVLYALGFALVALPYGIMIGMALGLLNIIPYLGSIVGLGVALPLAYFGDGGSILRVALVLVVFSVVQAIEAYILTPRIMGDRTGLHPALIIFAVFFWGVAIGGVLGMVLAVPLTAFAVVFWRLLKKKYISEVI